MKREIFKRLAVICLAVAAAGAYLWIGLFLGSIDTIIFSVIAALTVLAVLWPITSMPARARTRGLSLPCRLLKSPGGQNPASEDGRKAKTGEGGEVER